MITLPSSSLNIRLIVFQVFVLVLAPIWIFKLTHYFSLPMLFLFSSPSLVPLSQDQSLNSFSEVNLTKTFINVLLFGVFFLQHIVMARLSFKLHCSQIWPMFPTYQRLIYNTISSILIMVVLEYQQPQHYIFFTLSSWICIPLAAIGLIFFIDANLQMEASLLLPYKFSQLFNIRQIEIKPIDYNKQQQTGITIKGSYSLIRHPMQSGCILLLTFGNGIFTFQKCVMLTFMVTFIYIGVTMEEKRLLKKYKQYQNYMKTVTARFMPYLI